MNMPLVLLNRRRRGGFSPNALFALAEPGVWFDPSDVANLNWRRNLLTYTEQFDNAAWTKTRSSISANAAVAPDGTTTADKIVEDSSASTDHRIQQTASIGSSAVTASVYIKAAERTLAYVRIDDASTTKTAWFNLSNGTVGSVDTGFSASISDVGNGWYRCVVTYAAPGATTSGVVVFGPATINGSRTYTGDGTSGILIWGAQLELGSVATDYQRITDVNTEVIERFPTATLYQDTAGTTPVTAAGQSVALALDKSKGLVKTKTTLPTFTVNEGSGATTISVTSNVLTFTSAASGDGKRINGYFTLGRRVYIRVTAVGTGSVAVFAGNITPISILSNGVFVGAIGNANADYLIFRATSGGYNGTITVEEIFEQDGFHAVQATTANRPIYGIHPVGGRRNLLLRTEEFDNASWTKTLSTAVNNKLIPSSGQLLANAYISQAVTKAASATTYTYRVRAAAAEFNRVLLLVADTASAANRTVVTVSLVDGTVTSAPQVFGTFSSATATVVAAGNGYDVALTFTTSTETSITSRIYAADSVATTGNGTSGITLVNAQLETGSTATAYQRVTDQYNVTEAGVSSVSYLFFDGVNDSLATSTITPGVDKAQVFAGVRKLSDAARGIVVELSASTSVNNGSFVLDSPVGTSDARSSFNSRGTAAVGSVSSSVAAPSSFVFTGTADISGDQVQIRANGIASSAGTTDQGTGNFLAYPLYIGARAGTSLFFSGHLYSLIARFGPNLDTGQISSTETWVAGKTGIVI
ncbi:MAG: hypothetical protein RI906_3335 [Pseudomonadota bacterium]|jgi:hypothetical protein